MTPLPSAQRLPAPVLGLAAVQLAALLTNQVGIWQGHDTVAASGQLLMSATAALIVIVFTGGTTGMLGAIGMLGCFAGDLVPRFMEPPTTTLAMIGTFAVGQLFLVAAFWQRVDWRAPRTRRVGIGLVVFALALLAYLSVAPGADRSMWGLMVLYAVLLVLMAVTASVNRLALLGALSFVLADAILAVKLLGLLGEGVIASSVLMGFYGLALLLLALGLVQLGRGDGGAVQSPLAWRHAL